MNGEMVSYAHFIALSFNNNEQKESEICDKPQKVVPDIEMSRL